MKYLKDKSLLIFTGFKLLNVLSLFDLFTTVNLQCFICIVGWYIYIGFPMVWGWMLIMVNPKQWKILLITYLNDVLLSFSVSNFPTDFLSQTTHSTFVINSMSLH